MYDTLMTVQMNKSYTTAEVAKMLKISTRTLYRYLYDGLVPEPHMVSFGRLKARAWSDKDIRHAKQLLQKRSKQYGTLRTLTQEPPTIQPARIPAISATGHHFLVRMDEEPLTPEELAQKLKVKKSWIYEQTRSARPKSARSNANPLPRRKMGKYLRFSWSEVVNWLNQLSASGELKQ
jgi:predicted DNA-binding transcriptional regulator AlpA